MNTNTYLNSYISYLKIERALSDNTVENYSRDIKFFFDFINKKYQDIHIKDINAEIVSEYLIQINENRASKRTQSRFISSMRSFYKFMRIEKLVENNPMDKIDSPQLEKKLPDVLSIEEVEKIINCIDLSKPNGQRNRAIIEMLYACGLRVSELISLRISDIDNDELFIKIKGKGNKERLVPVGQAALKQVTIYIKSVRVHINPFKGCSDTVFLNNRGNKLTREMIFLIVKDLVAQAGVQKNVSPHTFRHSFATHLVQGGADIRIVQEMLGHESILTTEVYTHIDKRQLREVISKFHPLKDYEI